MLNSFTWLEFLSALLVVTLCYYLVIAVIFFRREILQKINNKPEVEQQQSPPLDHDHSNNLIGKAKLNSVKEPLQSLASTIESEQLQFHANTDEEENNNALADSRETTLIGTVADLIQDIKTVVDSRQYDRDTICQLLQTLLSRYEQLQNTQYKETISEFLTATLNEKTQHSFTLSEILSWWRQL